MWRWNEMDGLSGIVLVSLVVAIIGAVFIWNRWLSINGQKAQEFDDLDYEEARCSKCGAVLSQGYVKRGPSFSYRGLIKKSPGRKVEKKEFTDYQPGMEYHQVTALCLKCGHVNEEYLS